MKILVCWVMSETKIGGLRSVCGGGDSSGGGGEW